MAGDVPYSVMGEPLRAIRALYRATLIAMHSAVLVIINLSVRLTVRPSVTLVNCVHRSTYYHDFFTIWQPHDSSFLTPNFVLTFQRHELQMQGQIQVG